MEQKLLEEAFTLKDQIISDRRYLHTHAETGFDLKDTTAYVKEQLVKMGY